MRVYNDSQRVTLRSHPVPAETVMGGTLEVMVLTTRSEFNFQSRRRVDAMTLNSIYWSVLVALHLQLVTSLYSNEQFSNVA